MHYARRFIPIVVTWSILVCALSFRLMPAAESLARAPASQTATSLSLLVAMATAIVIAWALLYAGWSAALFREGWRSAFDAQSIYLVAMTMSVLLLYLRADRAVFGLPLLALLAAAATYAQTNARSRTRVAVLHSLGVGALVCVAPFVTLITVAFTVAKFFATVKAL